MRLSASPRRLFGNKYLDEMIFIAQTGLGRCLAPG